MEGKQGRPREGAYRAVKANSGEREWGGKASEGFAYSLKIDNNVKTIDATSEQS